jgi:hypothetical protein
MSSPRTITALVAIIALLAIPGAAADEPDWGVDHDATEQIARLTGPGSINDTGPRWDVYGTDLGSMFEHRGRIYLLFGDTFSAPGQPPEFGPAWRSNTMAWTRDRDPSDGLLFEGMITDVDGNAREILPGAHFGENADGDFEVTVIPTHGHSDNQLMYVHYMSVHEWGPPGQWDLNHSAIAYSADHGHTWEISDVRWDGDSNFGQVSFVEHGGKVYVFGIPGGRFGGVDLARVPRTDILDPDAYEYWDGASWSSDEASAQQIVEPPVGELSVQWNSHYGRWVMMYLNDEGREEWGTGAVVLRTADCLTGPWSDEQVVVTSLEVPQLYSPYMPPRWNNGPEIYFTLSRFNLYDVFWWKTELEGDLPENPHDDRCITP